MNELGDVITPGKIINFVDDRDRTVSVVSNGESWARESEYTRVEKSPLGIRATGGEFDQHIPNEGVEMQLTSTDDHAYFVDTDRCALYEHIGWDRRPDVHRADKSVIYDLDTNYRRLSSERNWTAEADNPGPDDPIDSALVDSHPDTEGQNGIDLKQTRGAVGATSGSGLASTAGLVRVDEVFENSRPKDKTVMPGARIDHAISAVFPQWHIAPMPSVVAPVDEPFTWPATRSDGCGNNQMCRGDTAGMVGSPHYVPMGARIRLNPAKCSKTYVHPQTRLIVEALCTHGAIVIDSSDRFSLNVESSNKWDKSAGEELMQLHAEDFEYVDTRSLATVDPGLLWETTSAFALAKFGPYAKLPEGWYEGGGWTTLIRDPEALPGLRPGSGSSLRSVVDSPNWLQSRPTPLPR
jgi:hypothetical protein